MELQLPMSFQMNDQRSLTDQLETLYGLANKNGLYDAADWLRQRLDQKLQAAPPPKPARSFSSLPKLTKAQQQLLKSLREERPEPGTWTEILSAETPSARALFRKGLILLRGDEGHLEARLIGVEPLASAETRQPPQI